MPKGALLHVHCDAVLNPLTLLRIARSHPAIHFRSSKPLTTAFLEEDHHHPHPEAATIEFKALPAHEHIQELPEGKGVHDRDYDGG